LGKINLSDERLDRQLEHVKNGLANLSGLRSFLNRSKDYFFACPNPVDSRA
jgi:hypothetical protein